MKYIIKNCPACHNYYSNVYECHQLEDCDDDLCKNYNDCLLKRIVELCKEELKPVYIFTGILTGVSIPSYKGGYNLAQDILKHLEIEEVNEE